MPLLAEGLPERPPASLDAVLDATVECLSRHGISKTSLSDIAREMGVAPSTVYRKVGSVEHAAALAAARDCHRTLDLMRTVIAEVEGPRTVTVFLAECIEASARNPMVSKIVRDETDWVGRLATRQLADMLTGAAQFAVPFLSAAMANGTIRRQDPLALAHWIARIGMVCLIAPPPGDLRAALDDLLLPALDPGTEPGKTSRRSNSHKTNTRS